MLLHLGTDNPGASLQPSQLSEDRKVSLPHKQASQGRNKHCSKQVAVVQES